MGQSILALSLDIFILQTKNNKRQEKLTEYVGLTNESFKKTNLREHINHITSNTLGNISLGEFGAQVFKMSPMLFNRKT